jgi:integrase
VASQIRSQLNLGQYEFDDKKSMPLFKDFAAGYLETTSAMNHKPSTQNSIKIALEKHINPFFGDMRINQIERRHVRQFIQDPELNKDLAAATIRNLKAYLSAILSEAVEDELIKANPAVYTGKLIKKTDPAKRINPLTWDEKNKLEEALRVHYPYYYPFFLTMLRTGLRLGEIIALKPGDLDFNGSFIEVKRNCVRGLIGTPKSGKVRRVDMSAGLKKVLQAYLTARKKEVLKKGWREPPEWLFYNGSGNTVDVNNIRDRVFKKVFEKAGLRKIRMHDLRHTYATMRIDAGHNITDVSKQLGHHSIRITIDTYHHWMPGSAKAEVDQLDLEAAPNCTPTAPSDQKGINDIHLTT